MFRGAELPRLMTGVVMLAVLAMLIRETGNPRNWTWLTNEGGKPSAVAPPPVEPEGDPTSPPLDDDPEEQDAIREEFQALSDRTTGMQIEEMASYWRLFRWVDKQSIGSLKRRAQKDLVFNDLVQSPDRYRGKLIALDLNVRRILGCDAAENSAGVKRVYEVWGFTRESQAWLYVGVTSQLPKGMPEGPNIEETATFYGYFLKLQGYHEAGAKPHAPPLTAPLLVGRLVWRSAPPPKTQGSYEGLLTIATLAVIVVVLGGRLVWSFLRPKARTSPTISPPMPTGSFATWLEEASDSASAPPAEPSGNGQASPKNDG